MARYTENDIDYPSVTEVNGQIDKSPALMQFAVNNSISWIIENIDDSMTIDDIIKVINDSKYKYREESNKAKDIGSQVHSLIEDYIKFGLDKTTKIEYCQEVQNSFLAFLEWEKENNIKWVKSEFRLINNVEMFAGTCDAVCEINGELFLIDFKTSKDFYYENYLQVAAYLMTYNLENPAVSRAGILRIDKETGLPEFKEVLELDKKYQAFLKLLDFFYMSKKRRLKNNFRALRGF
jgi:hypothetical protein